MYIYSYHYYYILKLSICIYIFTWNVAILKFCLQAYSHENQCLGNDYYIFVCLWIRYRTTWFSLYM